MKKFKLITVGLAASVMSLSGCGHQHTFASTWSFDADKHWLEATCEHAGQIRGNEGNHIDADGNRLCDVCGASLGEQPHVHSYSSSWGSDGENHWHECSCGAKADVAAHVDSNNDGICDVCEATLPQVVSVSIIDAPSTLMETQSATLKANVSVKGGADKSVTWSVDKAELATISSSGVLKALKAGVVKVTATSKFDSTKSASVNVEITEQYWTEDDLATFALALPEPIPFIKGNWTVDGEYAESYGVIIVYTEDNGAVATAKAAFEADPNYNYLGTSYDPDYDCDDYYYAKPSTDYLGYEIFCDIYEIDGETTIECYFEYTEYDEWPAEQIASYMTSLGFQGTVPAFDAGDDAGYTAAPEMLEDGSDCVYITVTDYDEESELGAADYVASLNPEEYMISVDEYDEYFISPLDKSYTMVVYDLQSYYYYGFEVIVCEYIPDESIVINECYDLIPVGGDLQLTLTKGVDVAAETVITFKSSNEAVATVSTEGKVTGVSQGEVVISALVGEEVVSEAMFYVLNSVKDGWTELDKAEFDNIHTGLGDMIPFNKYFDSVSYDEGMCQVDASSSFYSCEFENYYNALIAAGWTDTLTENFGDLAALAYALGYPYTFEKEVVISEVSYWVTLELTCINVYQEDEESEIEYFNDYEGYLNISVYDDYIYIYDDAVAEVKAELADFEVETTADFPDSLPGSHYYVGYDAEYNDIDFIAYDVGSITIDDVVSALNEKNWDVEKLHQDSYVDEETGETVEAYDYIYGASVDEVLELEGYVEDGMVILYIYLPSTEVLDTLTVDDLLPEGTKATVYTDFEDVEGDSGAVYAGQCALSDAAHGNCIQIRSKNSNSGIYSAESAGTVCSITINFDEANTSTNQIKIVASNEPFESTEDLYTATVVGTVTDEDGVGYYEFEEDYAYFGIISANGAFYIDSIDVVWLA